MYLKDKNEIWLATGKEPVYLNLKMVNRHGLIAGATGTGKTVSLKVLAESFSEAGVPVFLADIKGDVSGLVQPGVDNENVQSRIDSMKIENFDFTAFPTRFWDIYGEHGTPVRSTISDIGPDLLARILGLNDVQSSVLKIVFKTADDNKLLLIDMKDIKSMLQYVNDNSDVFAKEYGNMSSATIGAIQRSLVSLEESGGNIFFNEPDLDINDWFALDTDGRGFINLLHCVKLVQNPLLYSTFMLWMLSELYDTLPEAGDLDKPKMVFFFDEAHLLFDSATPALLNKIEQVVKLIRSKGVGIYFITQNPADIPDSILGQLGNKIQHALRAYTPKDQKGLKAAAQSFRANPDFDTVTALQELGTGEALVSVLDEKGVPTMVERAFILPPQSFIGVAEQNLVNSLINNSPMEMKYRNIVDNISAYESLEVKRQQDELEKQKAELEAQKQKELEKQQAQLEKEQAKMAEKARKAEEKAAADRQKSLNRVINNVVNNVGRQVTNQIFRGLFGNRKK